MEARPLSRSSSTVIGRAYSRRGRTARVKRSWGGTKTDIELGQRPGKPSVNGRQTGTNHALDASSANRVSLHTKSENEGKTKRLRVFLTNKRALRYLPCHLTLRDFPSNGPFWTSHWLLFRFAEAKRPPGQLTQQWRMLTRTHLYNRVDGSERDLPILQKKV